MVDVRALMFERWCSSVVFEGLVFEAKRENITSLIHLLRGLTRNNMNRAYSLFLGYAAEDRHERHRPTRTP